MISSSLTAHRDFVINLCQELDWLIKISKSEIIPQKRLVFVGFRYDLVTFRVFTQRSLVCVK